MMTRQARDGVLGLSTALNRSYIYLQLLRLGEQLAKRSLAIRNWPCEDQTKKIKGDQLLFVGRCALVTTFSDHKPSSPGRFPRPTSKARKKRPGDEVVEHRYNEPLCNEVLGVTNAFLYPSESKTCEKEP
ncbi:unnamed protein product [Porites evermanni]|uniref:Uncharacterized protein n=1 Tax=Porites evermanni TaxID=104178 RepID=A0ABN8LMD9_9CNID|nr:unnamed protein product [Porites evermanni]